MPQINMTIAHVRGSVHIIDAGYHGRHSVLGTYVVKGNRSMVIDPGPTASVDGVVEGLGQLKIGASELEYVGSTHIHLDHTGGAWKLLERFPGAMLHVNPKGSQHMVNPNPLESAARQFFGDRVDDYEEVRGIPRDRIVESRDGEIMDVGGAEVQVIWTPGHSSHHQCYFLPEEKMVILGDAGGFYSAKSNLIMPTTPPPFNPIKAAESLDKLIALEPEIVCYSHFGFSDGGVEKLKIHKSQILLWNSLVEEGLDEGLNMQNIYERIRKEDPMAGRSEMHSDRREMAALFNLRGFVEYYEWKKGSNSKP